MRIAIYPGSFDPVTLGHLDIIGRSAGLFDRIYVGVLAHPTKEGLFSVEERVRMLQEATAPWPHVTSEAFGGLLVEYARRRGAVAVIRGLRAVSDFEYEFKMAAMNRHLNPGVETIFMMTTAEYAFISSSLVKEVAAYGGRVDKWVPAHVQAALDGKFRGKEGSGA